jgi:hypothetical protein
VIDFRKYTYSGICEKARVFAELPENIIRLDRMKGIASGQLNPVGDNSSYVFKINDCRVVYSVEEHPQRDGSIRLLRHCSFSSPTESEDKDFFDKLLGYLGFDVSLPMRTYLEEIGKSKTAINFIQELDVRKQLET